MTLRDVYVADLNHLLAATRQKLLEWPVFSARTAMPPLRETFDQHYEETRRHAMQLETLLRELEERPHPPHGDIFAAVARVWRTRHLETDAGDLRELSLVTAAMALDLYTLPLYSEAVLAADAVRDLDGARTLKAALEDERDRIHKLAVFQEWLATRLGAVAKESPWSARLMPGVWATETTGFASVPPRADSDLFTPPPLEAAAPPE